MKHNITFKPIHQTPRQQICAVSVDGQLCCNEWTTYPAGWSEPIRVNHLLEVCNGNRSDMTATLRRLGISDYQFMRAAYGTGTWIWIPDLSDAISFYLDAAPVTPVTP